MRRFLLLLAVSLIPFSVRANPTALLTFDVTVQGSVRSGNQVTVLDLGSTPLHTTATLTLPYSVSSAFTSDDAYATSVVRDLGAPQPHAGVGIDAPVLLSLLQSPDTQAIVDAGLAQLGVTGIIPSPSFPYTPRDYANISKRDVHNVNPADRFYTMFDATVMEQSMDLQGMPESRLLTMMRVNGFAYDPAGDIEEFGIGDIAGMLREISTSQRDGFAVQFTKTVDSYQNGAFIDRPFDLIYGGNARLVGFTVDGRDMLANPVPEPQTAALAGAALLALLAARGRRRGQQAK